MSLQARKQIRLENFDYNSEGAYFLTVCVKDKKVYSIANCRGRCPRRPEN